MSSPATGSLTKDSSLTCVLYPICSEERFPVFLPGVNYFMKLVPRHLSQKQHTFLIEGKCHDWGLARSLIDIPKMLLFCSGSQICILLSGIESQYKCSIYAEPSGEGKKNTHSTSLFRVCFENGKQYLKGHPISRSRWIGKKDSGFYK